LPPIVRSQGELPLPSLSRLPLPSPLRAAPQRFAPEWPSCAAARWLALARPPRARPRSAPGARSAFTYARCPVPARAAFKFSLISFKFSLIYVLRRALRRVMICFKFRFISVLRRALRRATIYFNFILFNVLRRKFSRAMFCFKFSSSGVCHHTLRRVTLYVIFVFNSSVSWHASSRNDSFNFSLV
jgi:hypothetical protein